LPNFTKLYSQYTDLLACLTVVTHLHIIHAYRCPCIPYKMHTHISSDGTKTLGAKTKAKPSRSRQWK